MFKHTAQVAWPKLQPQMDWVESIIVMELWLNQYVGNQNEQWRWALDMNNVSLATVAFNKPRDKTLFLLEWA